jgi:hypothetical protein
MIHHGMLKIGDNLYLIKHILNESYENVGTQWNEIDKFNRTFKKDGKVYFCEQIEEAITIDEDVENPTT